MYNQFNFTVDCDIRGFQEARIFYYEDVIRDEIQLKQNDIIIYNNIAYIVTNTAVRTTAYEYVEQDYYLTQMEDNPNAQGEIIITRKIKECKHEKQISEKTRKEFLALLE